MRTFLAILGFELRLHLRAPLSWILLALYFTLHLLTVAGIGIHLSDNQLIDINSPFMIFRTVLVLGVFAMVPAIYFVVNGATRDHERGTASLFFTTPVGKLPWLAGRFCAGTLMSVLAAATGLLGTVTGTLLPGLDPARLGPFTWAPFVVSFAAIVVPNVIVLCGLFFTVAALSRSVTLTFGLALALMVLEIVVNASASGPVPTWLLLAEPFGGLPVNEAGRYWTVAELNTQLPVGLLLPNRLVWLGAAALALAFTWWRYRLDLSPGAAGVSRRPSVRIRAPRVRHADGTAIVGATAQRQLLSQVRMDVRGVVQSPLFWLVLLMATVSTISNVQGNVSSLNDLPLHRVTSQMVGLFRYNLLQFIVLLLIYYSASLVHRERDSGVADIVASTPHPDWIMVVSKTTALGLVITLLLIVSMLASIAMQALAGTHDFEVAVYLQDLFIYNGFSFYMLCVLAVVVQVLSPGKWGGMLLVLVVFTALAAMEPLGFEHVLYRFSIPYVLYSDMNGFGHFKVQTFSLIAYWSACCAVLLIVGHLFFPRGYYASLWERVHDARIRFSRATAAATGVALAVFIVTGCWIFYNTNVLNRYETSFDRAEMRAAYERAYGTYDRADAPSYQDVALEVDLYPQERRLESRGTAVLRNNKDRPIAEFALSVDPRMQVHALHVDAAVAVRQDRVQGFYLFTPQAPLQPGQTTTVSWNMTRENRGFVNGDPDNAIVENGTYVSSPSIMPMPGYDDERELSEPGERRRHGLPAKGRVAALGDPGYLDKLHFGIDSRTSFRIVFSTAGDQVAVAPGVLRHQWTDHGRRYFEYAMERPVWPGMSLTSARYKIARHEWNGVSLEVYHDAKHPWNVDTMLQTAKKSLAYMSREFTPYPLSQFRILEYPRYRGAAQAAPGAVAYSESAGFLTDLRGWAGLDYATIHELAHQWWGGQIYGARMQGRQMLNETLAQYSTLMVFREYEDPVWLRRILATTLDNYFRLRSSDGVAEQPLMLTEDQGNISYNKGALVMFALQDIVGTERVHQGLRNFLGTFASKGAPFPTSRDLVNELRAVAGPEHQALITDLFEKIVLYDVQIETARVRPIDGEFEVTADVSARQFESDGLGVETEVPLNTWFTVAVFPDSGEELVQQTPLRIEKHLLRTGTQTLVLRVKDKPGAVGVDPYHVMIDRTPANNVRSLAAAP